MQLQLKVAASKHTWQRECLLSHLVKEGKPLVNGPVVWNGAATEQTQSVSAAGGPRVRVQ